MASTFKIVHPRVAGSSQLIQFLCGAFHREIAEQEKSTNY